MRPSLHALVLPLGLLGTLVSHAQQTVSLSEIWVTSQRGASDTVHSGGSTIKMPASGPKIFKRDGGYRPRTNMYDGHAMITLPGVGTCMLGSGVSLSFPSKDINSHDLEIEGAILGSGKAFLNINSTEMARHGGAALRIKLNSWGERERPYPEVMVSTQGARFFVVTDRSRLTVNQGERDKSCTVGLFDGAVTVDETSGKHRYELKSGEVVEIRHTGISAPRTMTKAEAAYDIGCKLASLGKPSPSRLPDHMLPPPPKKDPAIQTNSLGMMFVPVPGTKVRMCMHETRYQDFASYLAANPGAATATEGGGMEGRCRDILWGWEHHPITASWDEAVAFCAWLSQKEGKKYRLPTDEEWSYAAGVGTREKRSRGDTPEDVGKKELEIFPWGRAWPPKGADNIADLSCDKDAWFIMSDEMKSYDDGYVDTAPVMSFPPNPYGLYDMGGNVSEWCDDWYNDKRQGRVTRGGNSRSHTRSTLQSSDRASTRTGDWFNQGFRVVMEMP